MDLEPLDLDESNTFDILAMQGDDIMRGLGYEPLANGAWRDEDTNAMLALVDEIGIGAVMSRALHRGRTSPSPATP